MSCTQCQTPAASASRILLLSLLAPLGTPWVETKRPEVHSIPILIVRCNAEGQPLDSQQDHYPREGPQTAQYRLHGLQKPLWLELKRDASALAPSFSSFSFGHEGRGVAEGNKWENRKDGDNLEMERDNMEEDGELKKYMKIQSKMQLKENTPKVGERPDDEKMERQGEVEVDVDSKVSDTVHRNANVSIERKKDVGQATVTPTTMDLSKQPLDYFFKPRQLDPHLCLFSGSVRSCPVCPKIGHASVSICGALTGFISSQGQEMGIGPLSECAGQYRGPCAHRLTFAGDWESSDGGESVEDLLMSSRAKGNTEYKQQVSEDQLKNSTRHGLHQNTSSLSQEQSREEESTKVQQVVNHHEIKQSQKIPQKRKSSKRMIDYTKFGATFGTVESGNRFKSTWSQEIASGQGNDSKVKDIIDMKTTKKAEKSLAKSGENSRSNKILFLKSRSDARTTWDTARRAKRFVSRPRHLKVLLVIDDSMRQEYDVQAEAYVLTMGARAARVMADGSLESSLRMFITGITSLPGEEEDNSLIHGVGKGGRVGQLDGRIGGDGEGNSGDFDGNGDKVVMSGKEKTAKEYGISGKRRKESASMMLKSFCDWQKHLNEAYRHVQRHHDAAVLITRKNLCGSQDCETLGMAEVGTVCNPNRSCAVVEDDGVNTALAIAHELGHLLGLPHDESDQCQRLLSSAHVPTSFGVQGHVMGETLRSVSLDKPWSECSARHLMDFFDAGHGKCLRHRPSSKPLSPNPGWTLHLNFQCQAQFGKGWVHCSRIGSPCAMLWCTQGQGMGSEPGSCRSRGAPWADGSSCGPNRACLHSRCVQKSKHQQVPVTGGWAPWSDWGPCSRTCNAGVQDARRTCTRPTPRAGGDFCRGRQLRMRSCNKKPCPHGNALSFREEQCSAFNQRIPSPLGDLRILNGMPNSWTPKYTGVPAEDHCKLVCQGSGTNFYAILKPRVFDGTPCGPTVPGVCVRGRCRPAGCDGVLGSRVRLDHCGVCGGDGSSCVRVSRSFNQARVGYNKITTIPAGATGLDIRQRGRSYRGKAAPMVFLAIGKGEDETESKSAISGANERKERRHVYPELQYLLNGVNTLATGGRDVVLGGGAVLLYNGALARVQRIRGYGALPHPLYLEVLSFTPTHKLGVRVLYYLPKVAKETS
uniref:A disintegrin and metalloproteinase with thrombospondin motifs 4-like isoform X1 n=1 Tax=Myxine glutinosa TaxID=7769 RepID=UPI00358E8070